MKSLVRMWKNQKPCTLRNVKQYSHVYSIKHVSGVISWGDPQISKNRILWAILEYIPKRMEIMVSKRDIYTHIHSSIIHNSWNMEATRVSTDRRMNSKMWHIMFDWWFSGGWRERKYEELLCNSHRTSVLQNEELCRWMIIMAIHIINVKYLMALNGTLKNSDWQILCYVYFTTTKGL